MNSKAAAKRLKVSVRSLQRLAHTYSLTVTYKRGRSGKQEANYDGDEIERVKAELETPTVTVKEQTALATVPDASRQTQLVASDDRERFYAALEAIIARRDREPEPTISDLAVKPLLSIAEAQRLSGLSRQILLNAVATNELKAKIIGRAWRIKRSELEAYIEKL
jgi:excisionase family DNA binding protein